MVETPSEHFIPHRRNLWILVRVDDLRKNGLLFLDGKWVSHHIAIGISKPRRRLIALQHQRAAIGSRGPDSLFFHSRVQSEHRSKRVLVQRRKPSLQFVAVIIVLEAKYDPL